MKKIPILLCIDIEPNGRAIDPSIKEDWTGFEKTYEITRSLRTRLQAVTKSPVHFSWFFRMDPQIVHTYESADWSVRRYSRIIDEFKSNGDELGLHPHPWRWDELSQSWVEDFGDQDWVNYCVKLSFDTFEQSLKRRCFSFRFGDQWINEATLELVESLGARFDLTIEPGLKIEGIEEPFTGSMPDYTEFPRYPYRPSNANIKMPGSADKRGLWIIPLSTGSTDWAITLLDSSVRRKSFKSIFSRRRPEYQGHHDLADCKWIQGWVWDMKQPGTPLDVEIYEGDTLLVTVTANGYREDLLQVCKGNGKHAFRYPVPRHLRDGRPHSIRVNVAGSDYYLGSTPREINCQEAITFGEIDMTMNLAHSPFFFSKVMDRLLTDSENPYLALVMRTDVGVKTLQRFNVEQNLEYISNHPLAGSFVFETPAEAIERIS
jgi:hypothetical protein